VNPARQACVLAARALWQDQPSLGMLETANEVRVRVRADADRDVSRRVPGVDAIRTWLEEAIAAGELPGPVESGRRVRAGKARR